MRKINSVFSILILLVFLTASGRNVLGQDVTTDKERREAQAVAQNFVRRMQETRDVKPLLDDLFLPDFVSRFMSDNENIPRTDYEKLNADERIRLVTIEVNAAYLATLDVLNTPRKRYVEGEDVYESAFASILPKHLADALKQAIWPNEKFGFSDAKDFRSRLPHIEKVLSDVRIYLANSEVEQTAEFKKRLKDEVTGVGLRYKVTTFIGGENIDDCEPLIGFPSDQKFFRIETPLMLGLVLVKHKNKLKIVRVTGVDSD